MKQKQLKENIKNQIRNILKESQNSDKLTGLIQKAIQEVDENLSYKDLAISIAKILKDDYGSHNYQSFMEILHSELGID